MNEYEGLVAGAALHRAVGEADWEPAAGAGGPQAIVPERLLARTP